MYEQLLSKEIERHVHDCLSNCLFNNDLNYINQTEFRKILSTETTLANLIDSLQFNLDCDRVNGIVTVEYKKNILYGRPFDSPY